MACCNRHPTIYCMKHVICAVKEINVNSINIITCNLQHQVKAFLSRFAFLSQSNFDSLVLLQSLKEVCFYALNSIPTHVFFELGEVSEKEKHVFFISSFSIFTLSLSFSVCCLQVTSLCICMFSEPRKAEISYSFLVFWLFSLISVLGSFRCGTTLRIFER